MRSRAAIPALFVLGFMLMQFAWIITIPPFRGSDEFDHAYRAAAVASGDWISKERPVNGRGVLVEVPESLVAAAHDQCAHLTYTGHDNCSPASDTRDGMVLVGSGSGTYHPAFYWVVGAASAWLDGASRLYAMRIIAALLCSLFIGAAAWSATRMRSRWPLAGLFVAASPVLVYSTSIVAPNGLEMCAAMALWTSLLTLGTRARDGLSHEGRLLWVAIISAVVLSTLRLLGPLFVLAIVVTVALFEWRGLWSTVRRHRATVTAGAILVAVSVANFLWWITGPASVPPADAPEGDALSPIYLLVWTLQSIAAFPFRDQLGALVVYPVVGTLAAVLVIFACRISGRRQSIVLGFSLLAALLLPFAATAATSATVGVIWQGRYGLPYAAGFLIMAGYAIAHNLPHLRIHWRLAVPAAASMGLAVAACLIKIRHDELTENVASMSDPTWHPPFVITLALLTLIASAVTACSMSIREHEHPVEPEGSPA